MITNTLCPCGSKKMAGECCHSIISGKRKAATAEELMRSRYVAYATFNINYLMVSQHTRTRQLRDRKGLERWAKSVQWIGLAIIGTEDGQATDTTGMVEFKAMYIENGSLQQIHEKSLFEHEKGKWVYVTGKHY